MIDSSPYNYEIHHQIIIDAQGGLIKFSKEEVDRGVNTILGMMKLMDDWKKEDNINKLR